MAEAHHPNDASAISSSMTHSAVRQSGRPHLPTAKLHEMLRRAKSDGYQSSLNCSQQSIDLGVEESEKARNETSPPVRANSKRRRSTAPTPAPEIRQRSLSCTSSTTSLHSDRDLCDRGPSSPSESYFSISHSESSSHESLPRGRTRTRDELVVHASQSVKKGVFRFRQNRRPDEFHFPKSRSQPEPLWCPGDGFSDDEAKPQFPFPMTQRRKRKASRSLSALGQLPLDAKGFVDDAKSTASRQRKRRGEVSRELWPTRDNFMETPDISKATKDVFKISSMAEPEPTVPPIPRNPTASSPRNKQAVPRKRQTSDFENFGKRRRKSQSRHRRTPPSSSTRVKRSSIRQTSEEDTTEKERDDVYLQREEDEEEDRAQSVDSEELYDIDDNLQHLSTDESDHTNGSEDMELDGIEERIQSTVPDSQPEFDEKSFYSRTRSIDILLQCTAAQALDQRISAEQAE